MQQTSELRVTSGLHRGASAPLQRPALVVVGTADDCDLMLMDSGVAPRHAAITVHETEIGLRPLDSVIGLNGESIAPGRTVTVKQGDQIEIGDATLVVGELALEPVARQQIVSRRAVTASVVVCGVALVLVAARFVSSSSIEPQAVPPEQRIATTLAQLGLKNDITSSVAPDGTITLTGTTPDDETYAALLQELSREDPAPVLQVISRERVTSDVQNVFRVNGMDVDAEYTEPGVVVVHGASGRKEDIDRVVQHAIRDVRGLKEVRLDGSSVSPALVAVDPAGKRVVSVVDGSPAYLVTADGARYFIGATLPQGQRVVAIQGNAVTLERNGQQLVMNF